MQVFLSRERVSPEQIFEREADAVDITTDKYVIRIRKSGLEVFEVSKETGSRELNTILAQNLDLT